MRALADRRGEAGEPVRQILAREPERLRTLYDLTGGNPRVLALIYQLLERRETGDVFADLEALLDLVSPYYKARVEDYATAQQRSVIDAIALNWDPITSHDLSAKAGIEITTTSSHLNRMKKDGFIEEVATSGARSGYQLVERFLNIWYLMRHGTRRTRLRLQWLTKFLSRLYGVEELGRMAREARNEAGSCVWHPDYREAVIAAFQESSLTSAPMLMSERVETITRKVLGQSATDEVPNTRQLGATRQTREASAIEALRNRANKFTGRRDFASAVRVLDEIVLRFDADSEPALSEAVASALVSKGYNLGRLGRREEAVAVYDDVVARFGAASEPALREPVARALVYKGADLGALGREKEAIATFDEVAVRFDASDVSSMRDFVQDALWQKGNILFDDLGDLEGAESAYSEAVNLARRSTMASGNYAWLLLTTLRVAEARDLRAKLENLPSVGRALLDAGLELAGENFGSAVGQLAKALEGGLDHAEIDFFDDFLRFLRLAQAGGYGERLIAWFETSGNAEKYAPAHAAFVAFVRGERFLLDFSPEVRRPAREIFDKLTAPRRNTRRGERLAEPRPAQRAKRKSRK